MNRDPENRDCTRDPIYLLQSCNRQWTQIPDGLESNGESWCVTEPEYLDDWIKPFIEWDEEDPSSGYLCMSEEFYKAADGVENDHGWPLIYEEWRTESVFLTRSEATAYAEVRKHRYDKWRVYCIPCDGELARILREYEPQDKKKYLVFAGSYKEACEWATQKGFNQTTDKWKFLGNESDLRGLRDYTVIFYGTFTSRLDFWNIRYAIADAASRGDVKYHELEGTPT